MVYEVYGKCVPNYVIGVGDNLPNVFIANLYTLITFLVKYVMKNVKQPHYIQ